MFDPTAFDNMKVIIEGAIYDLDFAGEIKVSDRKDFIDLARLSRMFSLSFEVGDAPGIEAELRLIAGLENLASELLPSAGRGLDGCELFLLFKAEHKDTPSIYRMVDAYASSIWGSERKISQSVSWDPLLEKEEVRNEISVDFNRLVTEAQLEELKEIPVYMVETVKGLFSVIFAQE
ncbi:hypothetical protein [Bacillus sp. FJAT-27245]|uniref:hypothetical protein n=1 Tax=Bacillus sp. FJAT-27245 TaxID=1684144 RepID=UPI0006A7CAA9|nr:hypothetical protein [Bacillus sp. FJAT-27245]